MRRRLPADTICFMFPAIRCKCLVPRACLRTLAGLALLGLTALPARPLELQQHGQTKVQTWRHGVAALDASRAL